MSVVPGVRERRGMTLVEVMIAMVILAFLVLGGSSFMTNSRKSILLQGRKRIATEIANARMEEIRAMPVVAAPGHFSITNYVRWSASAPPVIYVTKTAGAWAFSTNTVTLEVVDLNGFQYKLRTRVRYVSRFMMELETKCDFGPGAQIADNFAVSNVTRYIPDVQHYQ